MIVASVCLYALAQGQAVPTFAQVAMSAFDQWDLDHNGSITAVEVEKSALDAQFHGPQAAALAALHKYLGAVKQDPILDKSWFQNYQPAPLVIPKGTKADDARQMRKDYATKPESLQSSYIAALKRLQRQANTSLYDSDGPTLADIKQGALGDCYFLAPLGALVQRNSGDVRKMITPEGQGFRVRFPDGKEVTTPGLTDTELAMTGASTRSGTWVRIMERAFSRRNITPDKVDATEDQMNGGSGASAGKVLTGHEFSAIRLVGDWTKTVEPKVIDDAMNALKKSVPSAIAQNRLVIATTKKGTMPKSVNQNHAYAILGLDAQQNVIQIWNPHNNEFKPKGPEGMDNGYRVSGGKFSMPLDQFARTFSRVLVEKAN